MHDLDDQTAFHLAPIGLVLSLLAAPHAAGVWTFEDLSATRRVAVELTPREREIAA
jgi:hypothetical protein